MEPKITDPYGPICQVAEVGPKRTDPNGPYSTVTDFAKFLGLSTSNPFSLETK